MTNVIVLVKRKFKPASCKKIIKKNWTDEVNAEREVKKERKRGKPLKVASLLARPEVKNKHAEKLSRRIDHSQGPKIENWSGTVIITFEDTEIATNCNNSLLINSPGAVNVKPYKKLPSCVKHLHKHTVCSQLFQAPAFINYYNKRV